MQSLLSDEKKWERMQSEMYAGRPLLGSEGAFTELLQAFVNASLEGEIDYDLEKGQEKGRVNKRNGYTKKTIKSAAGPLKIKTPRDRAGLFEPRLVEKRSRQLGSGMDEIILSLYARGHSIEDLRRHIFEIYGIEMSAGAISSITDRVLPEINDWQQRALDPCYVMIYLDAIHYKIRSERKISTHAVYSVFAVDVNGKRDVLGLYIDEAEGAHKWGQILEDLQERGVEDVLFFSIDGLSGFKDAINEVFPAAIVQRCVVHMLRSSTRFVNYKQREKMFVDLRKVYKAADLNTAQLALDTFEDKWIEQYPKVVEKWRRNWDDITPYLDYKKNLRRMLYTTNPVEALHRIMRKTTKAKGAWSSSTGLLKQLFLSLKHNEKSWKTSVLNWNAVQREIVYLFEERYTKWLVD